MSAFKHAICAPLLMLASTILGRASAHAACPPPPLINGNIANADDVTANLNCLAPLNAPQFTDNVGIGVSPITPFVTSHLLDIGGNMILQNVVGDQTLESNNIYHAPTGQWTYIATGPATGIRQYSGEIGFHLAPSATGGSIASNWDNSDIKLIIKSNGNIGIGTTGPVPADTGARTVQIGNSMIMQNVSGNQTLYSRNAYFDGSSWKYANGGYATAIRMNDDPGDGSIGFYLAPSGTAGASISNADWDGGVKVTIRNNGNVGIGTTSPAEKLEVSGRIKVDSLASASGTSLCIDASNVIASCSSSIRYKKDVRSAPFGLKQVMAMRPVTFRWKTTNQPDFGFIAEEMAKVDPRFVTSKDGKIEGVKYPQLTAVLVGAIKQLEAQNAGLAKQISALQTTSARQSEEIRLLKAKFERSGTNLVGAAASRPAQVLR